MKNYTLLAIVLSIFIIGYLIGSKETDECLGFGLGAEGKYMIATRGGDSTGAWVSDTQEGHVWVVLFPSQIGYVGQVKNP